MYAKDHVMKMINMNSKENKKHKMKYYFTNSKELIGNFFKL